MKPYIIEMPPPSSIRENETKEEAQEQIQVPDHGQEEKRGKICKILYCIITVPLLTKILFILIIMGFLLARTNSVKRRDYSNQPIDAIDHSQYFRLLTSAFITMKYSNLLLGLVVWLPKAIKYERANGTCGHLMYYLSNSIAIQALYAVIYYFYFYHFIHYSLRNKVEETLYSYLGILPYALFETTKDYLANRSNKIKFLCLPYEFNPVVYPVLVLIIFTVLNGYRFLALTAVLYGVCWHFIPFKKYFTKCVGFVSVRDAQMNRQMRIEAENNLTIVNNQQ